MKVFDKSIVKNYLVITAVITFALVVVISTSMMVEDVRLVSGKSHANAYSLISIMGLRTLIYLYQLIPIGAFVGLLMWGAMSARRGELIAFYVGGYSPFRIGVPLFAAALLLAVLTAVAGEYVVPWANNTLIRVRSEQLKGKDVMQHMLSKREDWYRDDNLILCLPSVDLEQEVFYKPLVLQIGKKGRIKTLYRAQTLKLASDSLQSNGNSQAKAYYRWILQDGVHYLNHIGRAVEKRVFAEHKLHLRIGFADLTDIVGKPEQLRLEELGLSIERRIKTGRVARFFIYQYHQRLVYPLSLLILVLISMPLALIPDRHRSLSGALGSGSAVAGLAYSISYLFRSMVAAGSLGPMAGAWVPIFATALGAGLIFLGLKRVFGLHY